MNNVLSAEAILPCLLDRLCDDEPENRKESHYRQSLTLAHYRRSVLRDLSWLLNTASHTTSEHLDDFPEVAASVLDYGTPDFCGKTVTTLDRSSMETDVADSIAKFEPRIVKRTLSVKVVPEVNKVSPNLIAFEIRGTMWANPIPEQFQIETKLDLETGAVNF